MLAYRHESFGNSQSTRLDGRREYIDAGVSGAKDSRPELNRLMADAHKRRFDLFASGASTGSPVPSPTCYGHWRRSNPRDRLRFLLRADGHFYSCGKMVFTVLGAVAELERSLIVERVRAGLRNARAKGRSWAGRV